MFRDLIIALFIIAVTPHEHKEFQITGYSTVCNSLFRLTVSTNINHMSTSLALSGWNPSVTNGFLVQIASNEVIISMSWHHHNCHNISAAWLEIFIHFPDKFLWARDLFNFHFLLAFHIRWKIFEVSLSHHPITRNLSTCYHSTNVLAWATFCNDSIMKQTRVKWYFPRHL